MFGLSDDDKCSRNVIGIISSDLSTEDAHRDMKVSGLSTVIPSACLYALKLRATLEGENRVGELFRTKKMLDVGVRRDGIRVEHLDDGFRLDLP